MADTELKHLVDRARRDPERRVAQGDLARRIGLSPTYFSHVLNGDTPLASDVALRLGAELGIPATELLATNKPPRFRR